MTENTKAKFISENNNSDISPKPLKKWRKVVRIIVIVALMLILTSSYVFLFSGSSKDGMIGTNFVGVFDKHNFVEASLGDLIAIDDIDSINDLQTDEVVVYQINGVVYSAYVKKIDTKNKVVTVEGVDGTQKVIAYDVIIGCQGKQIAIIGYIWGFCASNVGVVVISVLLLAYVCYITISNATREETIKGVMLSREYKQLKEDERIRKKLIRVLKKSGGFENRETQIIDGSMGDNIIELMSYTNSESDGDITETYNYLLDKVYRIYMFKENLSRIDRTRLSNVIELSSVVETFTESMAYKLVDLILRESLHDFDTAGYEKLCVKFLTRKISVDDMVNFGNVLYVLLTKNPKIKNSHMKKLVVAFCRKVKTFDEVSDSLMQISSSLKGLFEKIV